MTYHVETNEVIYLRLQSHIWPWSAQENYDAVTSEVSSSLVSIIERSGVANKPVVINCNRVHRLLSHSLKPLRKAIEDSSSSVAFYCVEGGFGSNGEEMSHHSSLAKELELQLAGLDSVHRWNDNPSFAVFGSSAEKMANVVRAFLSGTSEMNGFEDETIQRSVTNCYQPFPAPTRLSSTPILASGVFKASRIVGNPKDLAMVTMRLADRLEAIFGAELVGSEIRLLACSPHGASLAFCLLPFARQFGVDGIDIIDRLGPTHCYVEEYTTRPPVPDVDDFSYVLVADFVIGGSEIRAALAHAHERKRKVSHVLCLGSILPASEFRNCTLVSLVDLNKLGLNLSYKLC